MSKSKDSETVEVRPVLSCHYTSTSGPRRDSGDYLINFDVKISGEYWLDHIGDEPEVIHLGNLRATMIRTGRAYEESFSLFSLFDDSQEIQELGSALFGAGYLEFVEPIRAKFTEAFGHEDILLIRELTLQPFARGQRVGVSALHRFMTDWESGCSLIAILPLPMQFSSGIREEREWDALGLADLSNDGKEATAKLENHYRGLGFQRVGDLPYMLLSPKHQQAPLLELALEDSLILPREVLESAQRDSRKE